MPRESRSLVTFNRGKVSQLALARQDVDRVAMSAEIQTNYIPRVLGSMMLRPGLEYVDSTRSDLEAIHIPFVFDNEDTALIELTSSTMRVRVNEDLITRASVSTSVTDGTFTGTDAHTNVTISSSAPAEATLASAFNRDGTIFATGQVNSPYVCLWSVSGTTFTRLSNPASLPSGRVNGIAFSADGAWMALAIEVSPYIEVYAVSGTTFTKQGALTAAAGAGKGVAFSANTGCVSLAHTTTPFVTNYSIAGSVFTKLSNPASLPAGNGTSVAWRGSDSLAVAHATTPFCTVYTVSGTTFTKIVAGDTSQFADSAGLPAGNATGVAYSPDGTLLAVSHTTTPFVSLYAVGSEYTKKTNTGTLPDGNGQCVAFSQDGLMMAVGHATSAFLTIYHVDSSATSYLVVEADPTTPADSVDSLAFSPRNHLLAVTTTGTPFYNMYSLKPWVDYDQASTSSSYLASVYLAMTGNEFTEAIRVQAVYVSDIDKVVQHALNISVAENGPVKLRVGTTFNGDDLINETVLVGGDHSLAFTPNANFIYIKLSAAAKYTILVDSVQIAGSGVMTLTSPYASTDFPFIRWVQSGDVIFLACEGKRQYRIERRGTHSWSLVKYLADDGPFLSLNTSFITLTPSALSGTAAISASQPLFKSTHVGALFKISSIGQTVNLSATGANQFSSEIRVTGVGTTRTFSITRSGTWSATVTLQRSIAEVGSWTDVATFTTNATSTYTDGLDNQVVYYRIGIKTGDYTSGTADLTLAYTSGSLDGIIRISQVTNTMSASGQILKAFGAATASTDWKEGVWSDFRGWPTSVALYEGRLGWAGKDRIVLSVSDAYHSFDEEVEGDSAPINRTIGQGAVDTINWLVASKTLLMGGQGSEFSVGTTAFDEVLTPANYNNDPVTDIGSAKIGALKIDKEVIFAARTKTKLFQLSYQSDIYSYTPADLTRLIPEMCRAGIKRIAYQRYPDTRIHCVLDDGTVALLLFEREEDVVCWVDVETDGDVEDVVILPAAPGEEEDKVYYVVKRTINSSTKRYLERWALESECAGEALNKQADSYLSYTGVGVTTITGLTHLEGEAVVVWGNGKYLGTKTVSGGQITGLSESVTNAVVGLSYMARFKSTKLAFAAASGSALNRKKKLQQLGLILANTHADGVYYGTDFDNLIPLPPTKSGAPVSADEVWDHYDNDLLPTRGGWSTDERLCLQSVAPKPATILAATMVLETNG